MKIPIKMLSIATFIIWIIIISFSITIVLSAMNLDVNIGEIQMSPSSTGIKFEAPFSINNEGYYELADLNLTTRVTDVNRTVLDLTETTIPSIPQGSTINESHTISIDLDTILSMDLIPLLTKDSSFNIEIFVGLNFARVIPTQLSTNITIPWGAPLAKFSVGDISFSSYNETHDESLIPISFENHAILDIQGRLQLDVYNENNELITSGETTISVPSQQWYNDGIKAYPLIQDSLKFTGNGMIEVIFETPMFAVEMWEPYG
jgi:hypothetical protein